MIAFFQSIHLLYDNAVRAEREILLTFHGKLIHSICFFETLSKFEVLVK